ncbi:B3 domain-containing protein Os01g0234100-like [Daucus carota subsp. sativus]|uniref:B3 domain-containing protein Os01g0234100-like n=1 Tax=Daucus carota subsp. sativus TaxID=79200 RepID=UPI0030834EC3
MTAPNKETSHQYMPIEENTPMPVLSADMAVHVGTDAKSTSCKRKRGMDRVTKHSGDPSSTSSIALQEAQKLVQGLPEGSPSFTKLMKSTHVRGSFWLSLPANFCERYLSKCDQKIDLEDEAGQTYQVTYLTKNHAFSGGWRGFVQAHKLSKGDVLIFQQIMPLKFKVIIVRGNDHEEAEGGEEEKDDDEEEALTLLNLSSSEQGLEEEEEEAAAVTLVTLSSSEQDPREMVRTSCQLPAERPTTSTLLICDTDRNLSLNLEKFQTDLRDCDVYDKLPEHLRIKYFELCSSQNKLLHQYLKGKENSIYAAGMIAGVTAVSDSIRSSNLSTPLDRLKDWDRQLEGFEHLGMEVSFIRDRLHRLTSLADNPNREEGSTRIREAISERDIVIDKVVEMNKAIHSLNKEIKRLQDKEMKDRLNYVKEAGASW